MKILRDSLAGRCVSARNDQLTAGAPAEAMALQKVRHPACAALWIWN